MLLVIFLVIKRNLVNKSTKFGTVFVLWPEIVNPFYQHRQQFWERVCSVPSFLSSGRDFWLRFKFCFCLGVTLVCCSVPCTFCRSFFFISRWSLNLATTFSMSSWMNKKGGSYNAANLSLLENFLCCLKFVLRSGQSCIFVQDTELNS